MTPLYAICSNTGKMVIHFDSESKVTITERTLIRPTSTITTIIWDGTFNSEEYTEKRYDGDHCKK